MPRDQRTAPQTELPAGSPIMRARTALTVIWWVAQIGSNPYRTNWGFALAVATHFFYFAVLVIAVAAVETGRELDRARITSLERAQEARGRALREAGALDDRRERDVLVALDQPDEDARRPVDCLGAFLVGHDSHDMGSILEYPLPRELPECESGLVLPLQWCHDVAL